MTIDIFAIPALKTNYIWCIQKNSKLLIVDPGDAKPVINYCNQNNLELSDILITHHHYDHTDGLKELSEKYNNVNIFARESIKYTNKFIDDLKQINLKNFDLILNVLPVPGHTLDHIVYYNSEILFSGDTLFSAGCGRAFEGTFEQLFSSLQKLKSLPNDTLVYCAHEYTVENLEFAKTLEPENKYIIKKLNEAKDIRKKQKITLPSTIGDEKQFNPFFRTDIDNVMQSAENYANRKLENELEVFSVIRDWKDKF